MPHPHLRGCARIVYSVPTTLPLVSMIVPVGSTPPVVRACLRRLVDRTAHGALEVILVSNGPDGLPHELVTELCAALADRGAGDLVVEHAPGAFNFPRLVDIGVGLSRGEVLALVNSDVEPVGADWLRELVSYAVQPDVGAVGARLLYPDGRLQHGGIVLGVGGAAGHAHKGLDATASGHMGRAWLAQDVSAVTAACLVSRREVYRAAGGLDPELAVAFNDVDYGLKLGRLGYRVIWTPYAELIHHESTTRGSDLAGPARDRFDAERARLVYRWGSALKRDPAYNPNLSLDREDFALAWPPRVTPPWPR